jgi:methionyl-tRNA formyltransferase
MRIIFAGTPAFAVAPLNAIIANGHQIVLVLTQPDRPSGRGLALKMSDVKRAALPLGLTIEQPATLRDDVAVSMLKRTDADVMVVAAYGLILPSSVLHATRFGCINIHASLLPRWRGAAPIQRALLAGDEETGISIMQMDAGLDTGPVLLERRIPIAKHDTGATLHDKLAALGAECVSDALFSLESGGLTAMPQPEIGVTYAPKITKEEARIHWTRSARDLDRAVRAYDPAPGAYTSLFGTHVKVWRAQPADDEGVFGAPGEVIASTAAGVSVACGQGILRICELQRPGGRRQKTEDFLRGHPIPTGARFGA